MIYKRMINDVIYNLRLRISYMHNKIKRNHCHAANSQIPRELWISCSRPRSLSQLVGLLTNLLSTYFLLKYIFSLSLVIILLDFW